MALLFVKKRTVCYPLAMVYIMALGRGRKMGNGQAESIHYANMRNGDRVTKKRPRVRPWLISCDEFRELRMTCFLSQKRCAAFLGVSMRTVQNWDTGQRRVPWAVVRLLRLLRLGDLG